MDLVRSLATPVPLRRRPLARCLGRVLAEPVTARQAIPGFDNAAMDGYALRAADAGANPLSVTADIPAGSPWPAPLPAGADAVVPIKQADPVVPVGQADAGAGRVVILAAPQPGQHIRRRGEDAAPGAAVLPPGRRLRAADLAAAGAADLAVRRRQPQTAGPGHQPRRPGQAPLAVGPEAGQLPLPPIPAARLGHDCSPRWTDHGGRPA
ncbi:MAG: hypothetical protein LBH76_05205 [Propionibacteriaceae bacterium]|nr:hypothetical protein [Propionibacteriaceae bacterium]